MIAFKDCPETAAEWWLLAELAMLCRSCPCLLRFPLF